MKTKIVNGTIIDGSGSKPFQGTVLFEDEKIIEVSNHDIECSDAKRIDAKGKYVTPGFIDIHRHGDVAIFRKDFGHLELCQGITTIINGNCGLSASPAPNPYKKEIYDYLSPITGSIPYEKDFSTFHHFLKEVSQVPSPIHCGYLVGNGTLRMSVNGFSNAPLTASQIQEIQNNLTNSLKAGALGLSMGLAYIPENNYSLKELIEILSPIQNSNITISTHIRGEGNLLIEAIKEVSELAKALHVHLNVSHLKVVGKQNWGEHLNESLKILQDTRQFIPVTYDVYPYLAGSSQLAQLLPPWVLEGGFDKAKERLLDFNIQSKITEELKHFQTEYENILLSVGFESILITGLKTSQNKKYIGKTLQDIAIQENKDPYEVFYQLLIEEDFKVSMVDFIMDEKDVIQVMCDPYSSIISDSLYADNGIPHPRVYAAFSQFLSHYIRDQKIMPLEKGIQKLTSFPASIYHLDQKGLLAKGKDADILLFDIQNISANATYQDPMHVSSGIDMAIVDGRIAFENNQIKACNGKCLKGNFK